MRARALAIAVLLTGCTRAVAAPSPVHVLEPVAPATPNNAAESRAAPIAGLGDVLPAPLVRERLNLPYATRSPSQRLDVYLPAAGEGAFPLVVWVHGGGWERGERRLRGASPAEALLSRGFAVASLDYRLSAEAVFPAQIADVKTAIRYLKANAVAFGLDATRVAVWGESAGGHLAALAGLSPTVAALDDPSLGHADVSSAVQAVVDFYGPASFPTFDRDSQTARCERRIAGADSTASRLIGAPVGVNPELARVASPITYVSAEAPPFFVHHGKADCMVPWQQSAALVKSLGEHGTKVHVQYSDKEGHGGAAFAAPDNIDRITEFLRASLKV